LYKITHIKRGFLYVKDTSGIHRRENVTKAHKEDERMIDLYYTKKISPMLIKDEVEAFDDPDYIYEIKFDGIRCIAYIDPENEEIELHNKRHML